MKTLSIFLVLAYSVVLAGCSAITVEYDYDTDADFTNLNSFDWLTTPEKAQENELIVKRVKNAVNNELAAKGFRKVSESPDLLIAIYIGRQLKRDYFDSGQSYSQYSPYRTRGTISTYEYEEGTLTLDFVNAGTKELILRGTAKAVINPAITPEEREKRINEAVSKILEKFPSLQPN
ncbi:MAG: DUF4136 domain-containing protein [Planctomycetes bacterium]|nr:DUF4136 domain-containing protein [Planctomycetota bacterium]